MIDRSRSGHFAVFVLATLVSTAAAFSWKGGAQAQSAEYLRLSQDAIAEADAGRFAEAYALFLSAYRLEPNARAARALGNTAFELRRYADAMRHFEEALASTARPLTPAQRTEVEAMVERTGPFVGRYVLSIEPEHATATLDATPIDVSQPVWIDLGDHELLVSAPGYTELRRTLAVRGGERESIDLALTGRGLVSVAGGFGSVEVRGGAGGRVMVDGTFVCTAPCRAEHIAVGPREVRVERIGYEPFRTLAEVTADQVALVTVEGLVGTPDVWTLRVPERFDRRLLVSTTSGVRCEAVVAPGSPCTLTISPGTEEGLTFEAEDGSFRGTQFMPRAVGGLELSFAYDEYETGWVWALFAGTLTSAGPISTWIVAGVADGGDAPDTELLYGVAAGVTALWLAIVIPLVFLDRARVFALDYDIVPSAGLSR